MQLRQDGKRIAQAGQVARTGAAQCDARGDAFHVDAGFEMVVGGVMHVAQLLHSIQPRAQHVAVAQRMVQPVGEQAAAHVGGAGVEQRQQGGRGFAAQGLGDLQVAPRGGIHAHVAVGVVHLHGANMRDTLALREPRVAEQRTRRFQSDGEIVAAEAGQVERGELLAQRAARRFEIEVPVG